MRISATKLRHDKCLFKYMQLQHTTHPKVISSMDTRILVADDQPTIVEALLFLLKAQGIAADQASNPEEVATLVATRSYDLLLMDMNYARDTTSGSEGLELVERIKTVDPALGIVVMTAWSTIDIAVAALQRGASDFVQKPWDNDATIKILDTQIKATRGRRRELAMRLAEIEEAATVHRTLMGASLGTFGRFTIAASTRPHREVGGDYFDLFEVEKDKIALCIADVMGKGVGAALLMANMQAHFRVLMERNLDPASVCQSLNSTLLRAGNEKLMSMMCASLNVQSGEFVYSTAGHPPAILLRGTGETESLTSDDAILGSFASWTYKAESRKLLPGDRVVMVTDGFLESEDETGEELGQDRLCGWAKELRHLPAAEFQAQMNRRLLDFAKSSIADDATVMVIAAD
jgi:phosphoserine phosphatase RsbU/P